VFNIYADSVETVREERPPIKTASSLEMKSREISQARPGAATSKGAANSNSIKKRLFIQQAPASPVPTKTKLDPAKSLVLRPSQSWARGQLHNAFTPSIFFTVEMTTKVKVDKVKVDLDFRFLRKTDYPNLIFLVLILRCSVVKPPN